MNVLASLIAGLVFGIGLILSGMSNPAKVLNFLDLLGSWDASLIFVMGGAIAVTMPGFWVLRKSAKPLLAESFSWPARTDIDNRLIAGSAMFGVGWGIAGFCPGPAFVALPQGQLGVTAFVLAMLFGMLGGRIMLNRSALSVLPDKPATSG